MRTHVHIVHCTAIHKVIFWSVAFINVRKVASNKNSINVFGLDEYMDEEYLDSEFDDSDNDKTYEMIEEEVKKTDLQEERDLKEMEENTSKSDKSKKKNDKRTTKKRELEFDVKKKSLKKYRNILIFSISLTSHSLTDNCSKQHGKKLLQWLACQLKSALHIGIASNDRLNIIQTIKRSHANLVQVPLKWQVKYTVPNGHIVMLWDFTHRHQCVKFQIMSFCRVDAQQFNHHHYHAVKVCSLHKNQSIVMNCSMIMTIHVSYVFDFYLFRIDVMIQQINKRN